MSFAVVSADTPLPRPPSYGRSPSPAHSTRSRTLPVPVRSHIFWHGHRDRATGKLQRPMLFFVYQTTRHGPQNGFRLCLVHRGFSIASESKADGDPEDDIDRLERVIPQGHMEVVVLGDGPATADGHNDGED